MYNFNKENINFLSGKDFLKLLDFTPCEISKLISLAEELKDMKKKSEITEDDLKNGEKKMQDLTDRFTKEADKMAEAKQKEIMEI